MSRVGMSASHIKKDNRLIKFTAKNAFFSCISFVYASFTVENSFQRKIEQNIFLICLSSIRGRSKNKLYSLKNCFVFFCLLVRGRQTAAREHVNLDR